MTTQQAVDIFKMMIDKSGSPDIVDAEIVKYLNMASNEWLNRLFPDSQGKVINYELDANTAYLIKPLFYNLTLTLDSNDKITNEKLSDKLISQSDDQSACIFRIVAVAVEVTESQVTKTYPAKYTSYNNLWAFGRNYFKKSSNKKPLYTYTHDGFQFYSDGGGNVKVTVIKKPTDMSLAPKVSNPEFSDYAMQSIIGLALKLAGISIRDTELLQDTRLSGIMNMN